MPKRRFPAAVDDRGNGRLLHRSAMPTDCARSPRLSSLVYVYCEEESGRRAAA